MPTEVSLIREARDLARATPNREAAKILLAAADDLNAAYDVVKVTLTRGSVTQLVTHATRVLVMIEAIQRPRDPSPPKADAVRETPGTKFELDRNANIA